MKTPILGLAATALLSACANLSAPTPDEIARLPVVTYGESAPGDGDFVLRYPAGVDLPVTASVTGSLLSKTDQSGLSVRVKQDVYVYRNQVSFDGKEWREGPARISGRFFFELPGQKDGKFNAASPGELGAVFDLNTD